MIKKILITYLSFFLAVVQPSVSVAKVIQITDSEGVSHAVETDTDCTKTSEICLAHDGNGLCTHYQRYYDCNVPRPAVCVDEQISMQCNSMWLCLPRI